MGLHRSRPEVIKRLRRAHGHLAKVIEMLEGHADCLMVAQQLQAVINAVSNAKILHVQDHIEDCLEKAIRDGIEGGRPDVSAFKEIAKYL